MWNAICLPFSLSEGRMKTLFGEGYNLDELTSVSDDNGTTLNFKAVTGAMEAGKPYIVKPTKSTAASEAVVFEHVDITAPTPTEIEVGSVIFQGIYSPTRINDKADNPKQVVFIGANNTLYWPNNSNPLKAFRAYFVLPESFTGSNVSLSVDDQGIADRISLAEMEGTDTPSDGPVYSISGQRMADGTTRLPKGIYIRNGRKHIIH